MRYWPLPSLTTVRTLYINAALVASTVTAGSKAPDASCTVPAIACANAAPGTPDARERKIANVRRARTIIPRRVKLHPRTTLRRYMAIALDTYVPPPRTMRIACTSSVDA